MRYPTKIYVDKGIQIGPEQHYLNDPTDRGYVNVPGYKAIKLDFRARGRQILPDGSEISSSLSVNQGGVYYTEVFSLPVPAGTFFYHQDDEANETSILLFNTERPDNLAINIFYQTRGSKIKSAALNIYNYGKDTFNSSGEITVVHNYPDAISDIIVLATAEDGSAVSYSVNAVTKTVTLTGSVGISCSYMLIAIPTI